MDDLTKPLFLGRLRHKLLTSMQMVNSLEALSGGTSSSSISPRPQWAGAHIPTGHPNGWFDLNHFSWAGSDLSGESVITDYI